MRKKIITSTSALYLQKVISREPNKLMIEMPFGFNPNKMPEYIVSTQNPATIDIGVEPYDDKYDIYCKERLFVEYEKIPLEPSEIEVGLEKLLQVVNPQVVGEIYAKLKGKRRGLNCERIESYLEKSMIQIKDALLDKSLDKSTVLREYIMALVSKIKILCNIIKGGFAFELYLANDDQTILNTIIDILGNKNNAIYFKPLNLNEVVTSNTNELILIPYSKSNILNDVLWMNVNNKTKMQVKL